MTTKFLHSIIMLIKVAGKECHGAKQNSKNLEC